MKNLNFERKASDLLAVLGNPFRIQIILAIGEGEACVCHLETVLNKRQAYISQHLMALRDGGILETRREGKYIFYKLSNPKVFELIRAAGLLAGVEKKDLPELQIPLQVNKCVCPHCEGEISILDHLSSSNVGENE
ncbi:MAG: ArsR/SmtB family transcription factor [Anaerolineaceae bacterium]|jgi:ArsR family transcriptional regulator